MAETFGFETLLDTVTAAKRLDVSPSFLAKARMLGVGLNSPPPWPKDRKRAYVEWARAVVSGLPFRPVTLTARFEEAARLATESIEQQA